MSSVKTDTRALCWCISLSYERRGKKKYCALTLSLTSMFVRTTVLNCVLNKSSIIMKSNWFCWNPTGYGYYSYINISHQLSSTEIQEGLRMRGEEIKLYSSGNKAGHKSLLVDYVILWEHRNFIQKCLRSLSCSLCNCWTFNTPLFYKLKGVCNVFKVWTPLNL